MTKFTFIFASEYYRAYFSSIMMKMLDFNYSCESRRKDHLGTTRAVLAADGSVSDEMMYDAYGKQYVLGQGSGAKVRERFTGKEFDDESGMNLDYFGKRYFDPEIGRWTSKDPRSQHFDLYNYSGGHPISKIDPDGGQDEMPNWQMQMLNDYFKDFYQYAQSPQAMQQMKTQAVTTANQTAVFAGQLTYKSLDMSSTIAGNTSMVLTAGGVCTVDPFLVGAGMEMSTFANKLQLSADAVGLATCDVSPTQAGVDASWSVATKSPIESLARYGSTLTTAIAGALNVVVDKMGEVLHDGVKEQQESTSTTEEGSNGP